MLLSRLSRQRAAVRAFRHCGPAVQSRSIFFLPNDVDSSKRLEEGIGSLMTPAQFKIAWVDNQNRLINQLNRLTDGSTQSNLPTYQIILQTARDPDQAQLFNHASLAHNTHFYFKTLSPTPTRPSEEFGNELEDCFSSASSFRTTFLATAEAMFAPGFVWLVQQMNSKTAKYAILCTYAAGSPYAAASFRRQNREAATTDNLLQPGESAQIYAHKVGFNRNLHQRTAPGGADVVPLMCVSTWEHMYLNDFGVAGKRRYLEAWWDAIDWAKVESHVSRPKSGVL